MERSASPRRRSLGCWYGRRGRVTDSRPRLLLDLSWGVRQVLRWGVVVVRSSTTTTTHGARGPARVRHEASHERHRGAGSTCRRRRRACASTRGCRISRRRWRELQRELQRDRGPDADLPVWRQVDISAADDVASRLEGSTTTGRGPGLTRQPHANAIAAATRTIGSGRKRKRRWAARRPLWCRSDAWRGAGRRRVRARPVVRFRGWSRFVRRR
jgi:hypothetical protein